MSVTRLKNRLFKNYYSRFILNVIASSILFLSVVLFLIYNTIIIEENKDNINLYSIFLYIIIGIGVFIVAFMLLEKRHNDYLDEICDGIEKMATSNMNTKINVKGDDELSLMAFNINVLQDRINELILSEKESESTKNELITNIAHDLRTPLTSIIGYLEIIVNKTNLTKEQKEKYTLVAYEKSKKLEVLIEDLFAFTKMNYGDELSLNKENIDIVELINQIMTELYPLFEKNNMDFSVQTNVNKLYMFVDVKLMVRLFENLINNAIKYGKDGKNLVIKITYYETPPSIDISVINFGKVIPEKSINRLFDKFYRVDNSRNSEVGGTGLGLAIAKSIVELHKGNIKVKSDITGTEFRVHLPVK